MIVNLLKINGSYNETNKSSYGNEIKHHQRYGKRTQNS